MTVKAARTAPEERLSAYLEAALDCVVMADASGRVVEFNPAAERTFGYTRDEALGRTLAELIVPPSLREQHSQAFGRFAETHEQRLFGQRLELTGMRADGSEFPIALALSCVESEPLLVCGALRDLTDARRAADDLQQLAEEQAALRRVSTLVAQGSGPADVFAAVAEGVARILNVPAISMIRFESDGAATKIAGWGESPFSVGAQWTLDDPSMMASVMQTGRPARIDDYATLGGEHARRVREAGIRSAIGAPIAVDGKSWGVVVAFSTDAAPLSADGEGRLARFTELVGTAISNTQAREDLRGLADEQAALRRVATLVAQRATSAEIFATVAEEVAQVLDIPLIEVSRYETNGMYTVVGAWGDHPFVVGSNWPVDEDPLSLEMLKTRRPARFENFAELPGAMGEALREAEVGSAVGVPILVAGEVWGLIAVGWRDRRPLPDDLEARLTDFTELLATAISDAQARDELVASRARIVTAADEARRRIERNLHDGTQQRLVSIGLDLQALQAEVPDEARQARIGLERAGRAIEAVLEDVREVSRGLHPALLSQSGLRPALQSLARRSSIPVELDVGLSARPSESIETGVYYVVSEVLANAAKYANASMIHVSVRRVDEWVRLTVQDDGVGGADPSRGSGLIGLVDRVEALGGHLDLESPPGTGTRISIDLPWLPNR